MGERYTVKQGDCVSSLAFEKGISADTIWNHPPNADLKKLRGDLNILREGDVIEVPDKEPVAEAKPADQRHAFKLSTTPVELHLKFLDNDQPRKEVKVEMKLDVSLPGKNQDQVFETKTDEHGALRLSISPKARKADLTVGEGANRRKFEVLIGHLDPLREESGQRGRLHNLGYEGCNPTEEQSEAEIEALRLFQAKHELPSDGKVTEAFQEELAKVHGC